MGVSGERSRGEHAARCGCSVLQDKNALAKQVDNAIDHENPSGKRTVIETSHCDGLVGLLAQIVR
jgi:hypothetical protein